MHFLFFNSCSKLDQNKHMTSRPCRFHSSNVYFFFAFICCSNSFFHPRIQLSLTRTVIGYYMYYYYIHIGQIAQRKRIIESQKSQEKNVVTERSSHIFIRLIFYRCICIHINSIIEEKKL